MYICTYVQQYNTSTRCAAHTHTHTHTLVHLYYVHRYVCILYMCTRYIHIHTCVHIFSTWYFYEVHTCTQRCSQPATTLVHTRYVLVLCTYSHAHHTRTTHAHARTQHTERGTYKARERERRESGDRVERPRIPWRLWRPATGDRRPGLL